MCNVQWQPSSENWTWNCFQRALKYTVCSSTLSLLTLLYIYIYLSSNYNPEGQSKTNLIVLSWIYSSYNNFLSLLTEEKENVFLFIFQLYHLKEYYFLGAHFKYFFILISEHYTAKYLFIVERVSRKIVMILIAFISYNPQQEWLFTVFVEFRLGK